MTEQQKPLSAESFGSGGRTPVSPAVPTGLARLTAFLGGMMTGKRKTGRNGLMVSFIWAVAAPLLVVAVYLWVWAADQYASTVSFSVQKEEYKSSLDVLGGIPLLSGSMISDTDILDDFLQSQELVENVDAAIDLRTLYSKKWPEDPVFAFNPEGSIEDLHRHTKRMVRVSYDNHTGLISLRTLAFTPEDARLIAQTVFDQSSDMINELSSVARADSTRFAKDELDRAFARLRQARQDLTRFRIENQIVDPTADLQGQMGILNSLQEQLASAMIEMDMLPAGLKADDARLLQAQRKIDVIRARMEDERAKFGETGGGPGGEVYAALIAQYEGLAADLLFAEETYRASLAAYDMAQGEARRQSRYLAAHVRATLAETSQFPQRLSLLAIAAFFLTIAWTMCVLIYFSIRDRR